MCVGDHYSRFFKIYPVYKGPFTYLGNFSFRVNLPAYSLLIGISLTFQSQLWPEKKPIFRSEFERTPTFYT